MFCGREKELAELNRMYREDKFQMPVIYGRRRVGKSTLIQEFIRGKKAVFFTAIESTVERNLELFSKSIYKSLVPDMPMLPAFRDFEAAFDFLGQTAMRERIIVVIDEYPYLAVADKSISSRLQNYIDNEFRNGKMFLILCGSSMSFMENQVLGYQSPLYGRRTAQFKIQPFDYDTAAQFVPDYSVEDKALVYGVTGGIPKYLELFDTNLTVHENIVRLFFSDSGYLYEEPANLLKQELREAGTYNMVIETMAGGANRVNEIATKTHLDTAAVSYCLKTLIALGIVEKESAVTEENNRKKSYYVVADQMFRFWYRFVPDGMELIAQKNGALYYEETVMPALSDYMGSVFEHMCRNYLMKISGEKKLPFLLLKIGRWWGNNPKLRREEEIDIVGVNPVEKKVFLGECKYRNEKVRVEVAQQLEEKGMLMNGYNVQGYVLCAKNGFTAETESYAMEKGIFLLTLSDLY